MRPMLFLGRRVRLRAASPAGDASPRVWLLGTSLACVLIVSAAHPARGDWRQLQGDAFRTGNAAGARLPSAPVLLASVPMTDGIYASPVVADGTLYLIDGAGVVAAFDSESLTERWRFATPGGAGNVNNVATPAVIGDYLHVGTTAGDYFVLDRATGEVVRRLECGEPILSATAVGNGRAYFATLGARVYAVEADGSVAWQWDFVREVVDFDGDRWDGQDWLAARGDRVTWRDHFVCSRDICLIGDTVVIPAGGRTVFLRDEGERPRLRAAATIPAFAGSEYPATFGQSADPSGNVFVQWHRRDNAGRVEILRLEDTAEGADEVRADYLRGSQTAIELPGLLSFAAVSVRGRDVYRVRPEAGLGLCRHRLGADAAEGEEGVEGDGDKEEAASFQTLSPIPSICSPLITDSHVVHCGLDGSVTLIPHDGGSAIALTTGFGSPITAPPAISGGRLYVGCEDGYLYVYGEGQAVSPPRRDLRLHQIRSPLTGPRAGAEYDWYTNYGDFAGTNANDQGLRPPLRMRWARRLEGTVKHLPVCGGGRLYTHTAEGQVIATEQDTGRLLWRRHWPDVYLSFTSPLYVDGKLLIPQAGIRRSLVRCLDAATGDMLWEAPFTGSPSWSRQFPPVVHENVAIYASGSGQYAAQGTEKPFIFKGDPEPTEDGREVMSWIYSNDNPYYPRDHRPTVWAWDVDTGELLWEKDFSEYGRGGNDCGICLLDGKLYYSTFFGYSASQRRRRGLPVEHNGLTACMDPRTGEVIWLTTDYFVTSKCTLSGRDGRLYIGGYNPAEESTDDRFVWCLDASDGSLLWKSDPVTSALNVVTVGERFIFSNALRGKGNVFDRASGRVVDSIGHNYACCRFTLSEPYVLGANMDMIDLSRDGELVSTGPAIDSRECLGAVVSNGRIFYTSQASGIVVSQTYGDEARETPAVWERDGD